jgi:predicted aspartyl protease
MQTEVNFRLVGGEQPLILLPTYVNDKGPYQFILDTGAAISLLSSELALSLGIKPSGVKEANVAGGRIQVLISSVDSLTVGAAKLKDVQVAIMDLSDIGKEVGANIDGNIGYNYLKEFVVTVDYRKNVIRLIKGKQVQDNIQRPFSGGVKFTLANLSKPLILVQAIVNETGPYVFALDTGASATVVSSELADSLGIEMVAVSAATTGGGHQANVSISSIETFAIGTAKLYDLPIVVADFLGSLSQVLGTKIDGIVGYNYLKEFVVIIDYPNEFLYLE